MTSTIDTGTTGGAPGATDTAHGSSRPASRC